MILLEKALILKEMREDKPLLFQNMIKNFYRGQKNKGLTRIRFYIIIRLSLKKVLMENWESLLL